MRTTNSRKFISRRGCRPRHRSNAASLSSQKRCADCHGLAGDGGGASGQYLKIKPFDFRTWSGKDGRRGAGSTAAGPGDVRDQGHRDAELGRTAHRERALGCHQVRDSKPLSLEYPPDASVREDTSKIAADVTDPKQGGLDRIAGNVISAEQGKNCLRRQLRHMPWPGGDGKGPGITGGASQAPRPYPRDMNFAYIFWRIRDGIPGGIMPPFQRRLWQRPTCGT